MTKEEKELLTKDLCSRLPYGVIVQIPELFYYTKTIDVKLDAIVKGDNGFHFTDDYGYLVENIKPYLRPMSSMTKEEKEEYRELCSNCLEQDVVDYNISTLDDSQLIFVIEFLYSHHIDFRGLIEKGLALEATKDMYKKSPSNLNK